MQIERVVHCGHNGDLKFPHVVPYLKGMRGALNVSVSRETVERPQVPSMWGLLVGSLEQASEALSAGDGANAHKALASAGSLVTDIYGELDPSRAAVTAHIQTVLEVCMTRIEHARRHSDTASVTATLQLLRPVREALMVPPRNY